MLTTFAPLFLIFAAFLIALAVLLVFAMTDRRQTSRLRSFSAAERDQVVFLFEDEDLLDATPAARQLLDSAPRKGTAWAHLAGLLTGRFPQLADRIRDLAEIGSLEIASADRSSRIRAEWHDGIARITIEAAQQSERANLDSHSLAAMAHELENLRANADHMPVALWREDRKGVITWCNRAYLDLADSVSGDDDLRVWPPQTVFHLDDATLTETAEPDRPALHRVAITFAGETTRHWFEVSQTVLEDGERIHLALPADKLVRTETSLNEFVTTLTKTFASLPIGLAIFNRDRELALFNPALMDLTLLSAQFLVSKPSLSAFLDQLRKQRMIPEPRDYKSWRQQMSELVAAAQNGTYEETWALPTGQTYRVTGRPHPEGAVALLFEDITAEISVTRRFRSELEIGQATLDALPQAVAVFGAGGQLTLSNDAYSLLWGDDPSTLVRDVSIFEATAIWQAQSAPSPVWDQIRAFVTRSAGLRERWSAHITLGDGRVFACQVSPLPQGATMVDFFPASGLGHGPEAAKGLATSTPTRPEPARIGA